MNKVERLERTLSRELSSLIPQLKDPRVPLIVTVEQVQLSRDGRTGKVLVSTLETDDMPDMLAALNRASGYLQNEVSDVLRLRFTPKLSFYGSMAELLS